MHFSNHLIVLTSPPASGKTYWIDHFASTLSENDLLVISPLRALANECRDKWMGRIKVVTPEEWLLYQEYREVVIFDEFHLNFYWGDSFRPLLWEVFYSLSCNSSLTVLLTATLSPEMQQEISLYSCQFQGIWFLDYGNRCLKFRPQRYVRAFSKSWISRLIETGPRGGGVNLVFCAYRNEVNEWASKLENLGYKVWSCVGGEAGNMRLKMASGTEPDFIIATSVLSHGVNLPPVSCIFFLYPLRNIDFWIQMVARGGRKGERYEVFALENPHGIKWGRISNFLAILSLSLKMRLNSLRREIDQWFLKESSSASSLTRRGTSS